MQCELVENDVMRNRLPPLSGTVIDFFRRLLRPNAVHGFLIFEVFYITHNDAPQSVGLLWTGDQFVAETST